MAHEDFVTYDIAQALKEAGFNWPTLNGYSQKMRIEPVVSFGKIKEVKSKTPKNYNDNRKGIAEGVEFCSMPTLAQAQKWLRKRGLCVSVYPSPFSEDIDGEYAYKVYQFMDYEEWNDPCAEYGKDYESALSAGIEAALKLLNDKIEKS